MSDERGAGDPRQVNGPAAFPAFRLGQVNLGRTAPLTDLLVLPRISGFLFQAFSVSG